GSLNLGPKPRGYFTRGRRRSGSSNRLLGTRGLTHAILAPVAARRLAVVGPSGGRDRPGLGGSGLGGSVSVRSGRSLAPDRPGAGAQPGRARRGADQTDWRSAHPGRSPPRPAPARLAGRRE